MISSSKEFSCHTHPIYLTYPVKQIQNLPLGQKKKKTGCATHSSRFAICFSLPRHFSLWLWFSMLLEYRGSVVQSSDSQSVSNYQGKKSFYLRVYSEQGPVQIHSELILNKHTVTWRAQFGESEIWFKRAAWNCWLYVTSCQTKEKRRLHTCC